jgi:predicted CoA-binding protein
MKYEYVEEEEYTCKDCGKKFNRYNPNNEWKRVKKLHRRPFPENILFKKQEYCSTCLENMNTKTKGFFKCTCCKTKFYKNKDMGKQFRIYYNEVNEYKGICHKCFSDKKGKIPIDKRVPYTILAKNFHRLREEYEKTLRYLHKQEQLKGVMSKDKFILEVKNLTKGKELIQGKCSRCGELFLQDENIVELLGNQGFKSSKPSILKFRKCKSCMNALNRERRSNDPEYRRKSNQCTLNYIKKVNYKSKYNPIHGRRVTAMKMAKRLRGSKEDKKYEKKLYRVREYFNKRYSTEFHIDHIVPLNGKYINGLDHVDNLQILEAKVNITLKNFIRGDGYLFSFEKLVQFNRMDIWGNYKVSDEEMFKYIKEKKIPKRFSKDLIKGDFEELTS